MNVIACHSKALMPTSLPPTILEASWWKDWCTPAYPCLPTVQTLESDSLHCPPELVESCTFACFALLPSSFPATLAGLFSHFLKVTNVGCQARLREGRKIERQSPSRLLPRNATNLAFRLFAPLIRMPLRKLGRVSVHSFSLMKHQISSTNNSCVASKHSVPSQPAGL